MFRKNFLQIDVIKHVHELLQKNHVEHNIIYARFNIYYY